MNNFKYFILLIIFALFTISTGAEPQKPDSWKPVDEIGTLYRKVQIEQHEYIEYYNSTHARPNDYPTSVAGLTHSGTCPQTHKIC